MSMSNIVIGYFSTVQNYIDRDELRDLFKATLIPVEMNRQNGEMNNYSISSACLYFAFYY